MFFYRDETRAGGEKRASESTSSRPSNARVNESVSRPRAFARSIRRALLALLLLSGAASAFAANGSCDYATGQGTGPADFSKYCWIDFSNYNDIAARSGAGQDFTINLPQGTLTFNLKVNGGGFTSTSVPTWPGAAFGNSAFIGVPGKPALYQTANGSTTNFTLSNIVVHVSAGDLPYTFVAADVESSNAGESLSFSTNGQPWTVLAQMPNGNSTTYPILSGSGTSTVTETGVNGTVGAYAFASDFPSNKTIGFVSAKLVGSGLQGAIFGIKYHAADMSITSTHSPSSFAVNGTGSYKLVARNNGPEANHWGPNDLTTVTDTLPNGLTFASASGTDWTCSASGQVVTCTSPDTTPPSTDMNPIIINVNVAGNAPTTVTNTATVANPYDYNSGNNSTTDSTSVLRPDLSTSTKDVVDTNGGDTNPGDTLEYTVTVKESNGVAASNVNVTDDMPAGVSNFTLVSAPAGSTNTSSSTGGANGTGQLNLSNISVPANGSVSIVYDVTVSAGDTPGQIINNTADIAVPNGTGGTPSARPITVSQSQIPVSGNKLLYVLDNSSLTRTPPTGGGNHVTVGLGNYHDWTLTGPLQKKLTLQGGSTVSVNLLVQCDRQQGGRNPRCRNNFWGLNFTATLYDSNGGSLTPIGNTSPGASFDQTNYGPVTANISIRSAGITLMAGHKLVLRISNPGVNTIFGLVGNSLDVEQYSGGTLSNVNMLLSTVINVDSINAYSAAYPSNSTPNPNVFRPRDTVYVRAVVSDPFGSYDVDPANGGTAPTLTLKEPDGTIVLNAVPMTQVNDSGAATKTFEYQYTLPSTAPTGYWTPSVTAWEGTEHTVSDTSNGSFNVQMPNLLILKSVQVLSDPTGEANPHALPGAILRYSINVTNQGLGTADSNSLVVTDPLPADVSFIVGSTTFSDGSPSSGLTLPTNAIEYCSNGTCPYTSSVAAGNPDPNITKIIFKPQGVFAGKANSTASAPQFTINFKVELH